MWEQAEVEKVVALLYAQLGKPYRLGGKWASSETEPNTAIDCSGLSRWIIAQGRDLYGKQILLPHGCVNQIKFCRPLGVERPRLLDLGFATAMGAKSPEPSHVIVKASDLTVIEARGCSSHVGHSEGTCPFNKVVEREISRWERHTGFLGWWRVPGIYDQGQP